MTETSTHETDRAARSEAKAKQTEALGALGFAPTFKTGERGMFAGFGLGDYEATYCLTCGAMVPMVPAHEMDEAELASHPLTLHRAWHEDVAR